MIDKRRLRMLTLGALLVVLGLEFPVEAQEGGQFVRGDVNRDNRVALSDVFPLISHVVLHTSISLPCADAGDIDDDGCVDLGDVIELLHYLFHPLEGSGLPAPYPIAGVDATPDDLGCGAGPTGGDGGFGDEIQHIFFVKDRLGTPGLAAYPGQVGVQLPIFLESSFAVEGYTISIRFDPNRISQVQLDFTGSVADAYASDLAFFELGPRGYLYGWVVTEIIPPYDSEVIPAGEELRLGTLCFDVAEDVQPGDSLPFRFEPTPPVDQDPPILNEVSSSGLGGGLPTVHDLDLPILAESQLFIRGDVSRDRMLDLVDVVILLEGLYTHDPGFPLSCLDSADVNDDGELSLLDGIDLVFYLYAGAKAPAAPFPNPGLDVTTDSFPDCL